MGVLVKENKEDNILTSNGFKHKEHSVTGDIDDCYEKMISIPKRNYYMWIAVNINSGDGVIYIEYNCGGEISTEFFSIYAKWKDDPSAFFEELDKRATETYEYYNNR